MSAAKMLRPLAADCFELGEGLLALGLVSALEVG